MSLAVNDFGTQTIPSEPDNTDDLGINSQPSEESDNSGDLFNS